MSILEPRVIIRFTTDAELGGDPLYALENADAGLWNELLREGGITGLKPVFSALEAEDVRELQEEAKRRDDAYTVEPLDRFFSVGLPAQSNRNVVAALLRRWRIVRSVEIEIIGPDPVVHLGTDPFSVGQKHLDAAPDGVDARYAWSAVQGGGGAGAGQVIFDIEAGWTVDHQDLVGHAINQIHGTNWNDSRSHGTSVLGVVLAKNAYGTGIAYGAQSVLTSSYADSSLENALLAATRRVTQGDVLLIEAQAQVGKHRGAPRYGPVETLEPVWEAIRLAVSYGAIAIVAAGNGTDNGYGPATNLDVWRNQAGLRTLWRRRGNRDFRDSGAIMVTAASSRTPHHRMPYATYGDRIDCYARGENVATSSSSRSGATNTHTTSFGGTSAAAAIVAGVAVALQGVYASGQKPRLDPLEMRARLSDRIRNTRPARRELTAIGVMPDLRRLVDDHLGLPSPPREPSIEEEGVCPPALDDPCGRPSVCELLSWYEEFCEEASNPNLMPADAGTPVDVDHDPDLIRHIPPDDLPNISRIRDAYDRLHRPDGYEDEEALPVDVDGSLGPPPHTRYQSWRHKARHALGFTHS